MQTYEELLHKSLCYKKTGPYQQYQAYNKNPLMELAFELFLCRVQKFIFLFKFSFLMCYILQ